MDSESLLIALLAGVVLDRLLGDPLWLPHPVVLFGKLISWFEKRFNNGSKRIVKGAFSAVMLIIAVILVSAAIVFAAFRLNYWLGTLVMAVGVFFCLAAKTLESEVAAVFRAADRSLDDGRRQVARIVGRDTSQLSDKEVRTAALETLAENLSDGVIAPLFWYALLGIPGMMGYKMINTLDSMIGYRNERYLMFGRAAAKIDDAANYIPARLTALLMIAASMRPSLFSFVARYSRQHASPNSGYPESAMAGILGCRFGGPHSYFGQMVYKPFIGETDRPLTSRDLTASLRISRLAEMMMIAAMTAIYVLLIVF